MRSFLYLALVLVALAVAVSAALDEFPRRAKTVRGPVDLDVKRVLKSRQLTREQLVTRIQQRASKTKNRRQQISPLPTKPFYLYSTSGSTTTYYSISTSGSGSSAVSTLVVAGSSVTTTTTKFAVNGGGISGTISPDGAPSSALSVSSSTSPQPVTLSSVPANQITCTVDTTAATSGMTAVTGCKVNGAPVAFCTLKNGSPTVYATTAVCPNNYNSITLMASY